MNPEEEISELANDFINGSKKSLAKLQKKLKEFFKGKTQDELNKYKKESIITFSESVTILEKKKITPIEIAKLDALFNKTPKNNIHIRLSTKYTQEKFTNLAKEIYKQENRFNKEDIDGFLRWFAWVLIESPWDDISLRYKNNELEMEVRLESYDEPTIYLEVFSTKLYENEAKKMAETLK